MPHPQANPANAPAAKVLRAGDLTVEVQPPDAAAGQYRGTRFNWAGNTSRIAVGKHEFVHPWKDGHDPAGHDDLTGLADEFGIDGPQGYEAAAPGGTFVKIGVGVLKRADAKPYEFWRAYAFAEAPRWTAAFGVAEATFSQELRHQACSYRYEKRLELTGLGNRLAVRHALTNLSAARLKTNHYCHHFFRLDGDPIGPTTRLELPYKVALRTPAGRSDLFAVRGPALGLSAELPKDASASAELADPGAEHGFVLTNTRTGAVVAAKGDRKLAKFNLWTVRSAFCPEPFVALDLATGETVRWRTDYEFRPGR